MLGPRRYVELLMPVYEETVPLHGLSGKRVLVQYDGKLRAAADRIVRAPFHVVEMLTEPPEGDMTLDECRSSGFADIPRSGLSILCQAADVDLLHTVYNFWQGLHHLWTRHNGYGNSVEWD